MAGKQVLNGMRISEMMGRSDFPELMEYGLNPLLLEGANEEPSAFEQLFQTFQLTRNNIPFPTMKGLVVGKIVEGQEIPFIANDEVMYPYIQKSVDFLRK